MADRYLMCERCPLRYQAEFYELSGAEELADRMREAGCPDWWGPEKDYVGPPTHRYPHGEPLVGCGRDLLARHLASMQNAEEGHAKAAEEARNNVARLLVAGDREAMQWAMRRFLSEELVRFVRQDALVRLARPSSPGPGIGPREDGEEDQSP